MSTDLTLAQSGKSGGDAFGQGYSSAFGLGGSGLGTSAAGGHDQFASQADATGFGGAANSASAAAGAFGGDIADNTAIGSINISF
jgi:hypothetical protein